METSTCAHTLEQVEEQGGSAMADQFDVTLEDPELLQEVELTTNLIVAASETDEHLPQEEIDRILGVTPEDR